MKRDFTMIKTMAGSVLILAVASCGNDATFRFDGEIAGGGDKCITVEKSDYTGGWITVDSTRTDDSGAFSMKIASPAAPEIYRASVDGKYVYFPVDSTENITLTADLAKLPAVYKLQGSEQAEAMAAFDTELAKVSHGQGGDDLVSFKRKVFDEIIRGKPASVVSYYVLTKTVDGKALYDAADSQDMKYMAAVATAFRQHKPEDPRTKLLEQSVYDAMRRRNAQMGRVSEVRAEELSMVEIELPDAQGNMARLSDLVGKGKPVVVAFMLMNHEEAPAINRELDALRKSAGVEVYQVCLDADQALWRDAARQLPWTSVSDPGAADGRAVLGYNVTEIPVFFIYNGAGELTARAESVNDVRKKL